MKILSFVSLTVLLFNSSYILYALIDEHCEDPENDMGLNIPVILQSSPRVEGHL